MLLFTSEVLFAFFAMNSMNVPMNPLNSFFEAILPPAIELFVEFPSSSSFYEDEFHPVLFAGIFKFSKKVTRGRSPYFDAIRLRKSIPDFRRRESLERRIARILPEISEHLFSRRTDGILHPAFGEPDVEQLAVDVDRFIKFLSILWQLLAEIRWHVARLHRGSPIFIEAMAVMNREILNVKMCVILNNRHILFHEWIMNPSTTLPGGSYETRRIEYRPAPPDFEQRRSSLVSRWQD